MGLKTACIGGPYVVVGHLACGLYAGCPARLQLDRLQPTIRASIGGYYPNAKFVECGPLGAVSDAFEVYVDGAANALESVPWKAFGTPFQLKIWEQLGSMPAGETLSCAGLGERIGRPMAMWAVGHANGAIPVAVVVPCRRVIGTDGALAGYGGGLPRKCRLLAPEAAVQEAVTAETHAAAPVPFWPVVAMQAL